MTSDEKLEKRDIELKRKSIIEHKKVRTDDSDVKIFQEKSYSK